LISAIDAYKFSTKHAAVTQAVDDIFKKDKGHLFKEAKESRNPKKSAFAKQLLQIALDNHLRTFTCAMKAHISDLSLPAPPQLT
jgi:hypothetical protein